MDRTTDIDEDDSKNKRFWGDIKIRMGGQEIAESKQHSFIPAALRWWSVSKMWFSSEDRIKARTYAASALLLSTLNTLLLVKISNVQSSFNSALSEKLSVEFYRAVWQFILVIFIAAPLFALNQYVDTRISIEWRNWMARNLIEKYLHHQAFFRLKMDPQAVDNPDQRITDDVRSYASSSVVLAVGIVRQFFYCIAFVGVLANLAPHLVFFLLLYCFIGSWVTIAGFGRRLTALAFHVLQREADLRFDLIRVRENAESIAFYDAGNREAKLATNRLKSAVEVSRQCAKFEAFLALWQNVYGYATILIPSLLMAPRYFSGEVRFGTITQVSFAFNRIEAALSYIINNLSALSSLAAETERLDELLKALSHSPASQDQGIRRVMGGGTSGIEIHGLTLNTPHGERALCNDVSVTLSPGQSMLIVGPSGSGKSSMLRAIAGLWSNGFGTIHTPPHSSLFFLPQSPYMPLGTLRQQLCFPDDPGSSHGDQHTANNVDSTMMAKNTNNNTTGEDAELARLLEEACLPYLLQRVGGLDAEQDWSYILSLGEQQRISFLRLLRKRPTVAFLDEATSGVDGATETALYDALRAQCACFVSVGHRKELLDHHSHVLECIGDGQWHFSTVADYIKKIARK